METMVAEKKIVAARLVNNGKWEPVDVMVTLEGEDQEKKLTDFFPDEIYVSPGSIIGMTEDEALDYKHQLDVEYLRS